MLPVYTSALVVSMDVQLRHLATSVARADSLESMARPMLNLLQRLTRLESTYLTEINPQEGMQRVLFANNTGTLSLDEGLTVSWEDTLCRRALSEGRSVANDVQERWSDSAAARSLGIQTYISAPVRTTDGRLVGTLCGASCESKQVDEVEVTDLFNLFSELLAHQIDRESRAEEAQRRAQQAESAASDLSLLSRVGDLCLNAGGLRPAITEAADLIAAHGQWHRAVVFVFDGTEVLPGRTEDADFLPALANLLDQPSLARPAAQSDVHGHVMELSPAAPGVSALHAGTGVAEQGVTALITVENRLGVQGGIVLVGKQSAALSENALRVLTNCSAYLSLLAERLEYIERLSAHALHDPLTGLPNRRYLIEELGRMLARAKRDDTNVHIAFIDLDGFKAINDDHGHETGDQFLSLLATRLSGIVRKGDLAARYGGDEFVVLGAGSDCDQSAHERSRIAERIMEAMSGTFELPATRLEYEGPSIGVITCGTEDGDADTALARADKAMYAVKKDRHRAKGR